MSAFGRAASIVVLIAVGVCGCGGPSGDAGGSAKQPGADAASASQDGPAAAVREFLEAVRTGNDKKVTAMFTKVAREQAAQMNQQFTPRGSDTARFQIGAVEYVAQDGARVMSQWTDLDAEGKPRTDEITWMLRRDVEGWRIAGMATVVFEGEPPLLLDFENLAETLRRVDEVAQEIERREKAAQGPSAEGQAQQNPPAPVLR